jgi:hypothetical protein
VKNNVLPGPEAPPLPNASAQSPSMFTVEPSAFRTFSQKAASQRIEGRDGAAPKIADQ